jgi:aminoglycoside phosphotransferase (APT) family kinase protein
VGVAGGSGGALAAAVAVAARHGVRATDPVVLRAGLNVLVHLRPAPVVARVAGTIAGVRPGTAWQARELAVAGHLARVGAPAVAPSDVLPPGPHKHDGHVLSFWTHVPAGGVVDPAAAGEALAACHAALRDFRGSLPLLGTVTEAEALLARLAAEERIDRPTADALLARIEDLHATLGTLRSPIQALHGDAHLNNVLSSPDGPLWNDWEDTCLGPVGWDAACLLHTRADADAGATRAEAALAASGIRPDPGELGLWADARALQLAVWRAFLAGV